MKSTFPKKYYDYIKSHPKKYLGQTFLIDKNILNKIGEISELGPLHILSPISFCIIITAFSIFRDDSKNLIII